MAVKDISNTFAKYSGLRFVQWHDSPVLLSH